MPPDFQPKFGHAAEEFQRYRPEYPPVLYEHVLAQVPPTHRDRGVDLGAGTGMVAGHLVSHFREVVAVEPDPGMAARIAEQFPDVIIRKVKAEEYRQDPESVDLVTIANALHWMAAESIFANVRAWLRTGAVLAVFDRPFPKTTATVEEITLAELRGPWKPFRDPRLKRDFVWEDQVRAAPGFRIIEEAKFQNVVRMSPQDYVGFWRSTSYGSAYAGTLRDPERYWRDLESLFATAGGAVISVDFSPTLVLAQKS